MPYYGWKTFGRRPPKDSVIVAFAYNADLRPGLCTAVSSLESQSRTRFPLLGETPA